MPCMKFLYVYLSTSWCRIYVCFLKHFIKLLRWRIRRSMNKKRDRDRERQKDRHLWASYQPKKKSHREEELNYNINTLLSFLRFKLHQIRSNAKRRKTRRLRWSREAHGVVKVKHILLSFSFSSLYGGHITSRIIDLNH